MGLTGSGEPTAAGIDSITAAGTVAGVDSGAAAGTVAAIAAATSVDLRIPKTMRALVKARPEAGAELREVPVPQPGPGEVLIRLEAVSLCGTDLHIYRWDAWAQGRLGEHLPRIFGHEMAGRVVAHGPGTGAVPLGTRVAAETHLVDWTCYQCRTGREHVCANLRILGVDADGAFAEYIVLPERNAWPSEGLSPEIAALQEPMGNAVFATFVEEITTASVAVLGCGPIGLMAVAICRFAGASRVFATDVMPHRREMAARMGADCVLDGRGRRGRGDPARDRRHGRGRGAGDERRRGGAPPGLRRWSPTAAASRCSACRRARSRIDLNDAIIFRASASTASPAASCGRPGTRPRPCCEEGLDVSPIITHRLPLAGYAEAFDLLAAGRRRQGRAAAAGGCPSPSRRRVDGNEGGAV